MNHKDSMRKLGKATSFWFYQEQRILDSQLKDNG